MTLLYATMSFAVSTYENIGSENQQFELDRGIFSLLDEDDLTTFTAGFSQTKRFPIASDLDNDGITEFYVFDQDDIEVYEGKELTFVTSSDFGNDERVNFPIIFDIDGDTNKELIFVLEETNVIQSYSFNGSDLQQEINVSYSGLADSGDGETMIACREANDCILLFIEDFDACSGISNCETASVAHFNTTAVSSQITLQQTGGVSSNDRGLYCRSGVPQMVVDDYDVDGETEYIFTFGAFSEIQASANEAGVYIYWIGSDGSSISVEGSEFIDLEAENDPFDFDGAQSCDTQNFQDVFTSPLVERDLLNDVGSELIVGYQTSSEEFKMTMYDKDYNAGDDFPPADDSNGNIIGNPFLADAFPESTGDVDFCMVGYNRDLAVIPQEFKQIIVCGSKFKSGFETAEFQHTFPEGIFNVTTNYEIATTIAHSVQHSNAQTDSIDLNEVLTAYGIYTIDDSTCSPNILLKDLCDSSEVYANDLGNSFSLAIDSEGVGNDDLIFMTDVGLFYIDDGIGNLPPDSMSINTNPCVTDSILKQNTTLQITVTATDGNSDVFLDDDDLIINVSIYSGKSYEQRQGATNITSGSPKQFFFPVNVTGASEKITVTVSDGTNDPVTNSETTFTVANTGLEFGDSSCDITLLEDVEIADVEDGLLVDAEGNEFNNNTITSSLVQVADVSGVSVKLIYVLLMLFLAVVIIVGTQFSGQRQLNMTALMAVLFVVEGFAVVIGAFLGIFGIGLILTLSVILLGGLGIWISRIFIGGQQGM
ncbi:MAG: hypothetical protein GWN62_15180 [Aliifodinibius sp.]|nr:hypothetical protein [Fodinibius sp.]